MSNIIYLFPGEVETVSDDENRVYKFDKEQLIDTIKGLLEDYKPDMLLVETNINDLELCDPEMIKLINDVVMNNFSYDPVHLIVEHRRIRDLLDSGICIAITDPMSEYNSVANHKYYKDLVIFVDKYLE